MTLDDEAQQRHELHKGHPTHRPLSQDYELIGIAGEDCFEQVYGYERDRRLLPGGDGRCDFVVSERTIDVKSYGSLPWLLREAEKPHAEILVLCAVDVEQRWARLMGWELDEELVKIPPRKWPRQVTNHAVNMKDLKPMTDLELFLGIDRLYVDLTRRFSVSS